MGPKHIYAREHNNFRTVSVFVFVVKEAFDLPCLSQDYKDEIELSELAEFCNKRLTKLLTHRSKVVYKGDCSCGIDYIGETVRNLAERIVEHSNPAHTSEPAKHLRENPSHSFTWGVLSSEQTFHKGRIVEGLMIQQFCPSLNKQVISYVSKLFPSGIT